MEIKNKPAWRKYDGIKIYCPDQFACSLPDSAPDLREWLEQSVTLLKSNEKKDSGRVVWPDKKTFFIKRFRFDSLLQKAVYLLFRNHAQKSFSLSQELIDASISVPFPVAVIKDLSLTKGSAYFICEDLTDTQTLKKHVKNNTESGYIKKLLERFALEIAYIHESGFFHGDLKWKNIMLGPEPERRSFYIDLDTAGKLKSSTDKRYALDLARFCIDIVEKCPGENYVSDFILSYSKAAGKDAGLVVNHMMAYHKRISAKHKIKYGSNIPHLNFKP